MARPALGRSRRFTRWRSWTKPPFIPFRPIRRILYRYGPCSAQVRADSLSRPESQGITEVHLGQLASKRPTGCIHDHGAAQRQVKPSNGQKGERAAIKRHGGSEAVKLAC